MINLKKTNDQGRTEPSEVQNLPDNSTFSLRESKELLVNAVKENNLHIVNLLLQNGTNIHYRNDLALGQAVNVALANIPSETKMIELLLQNGADPNAQQGELLYSAISQENTAIAEVLLKAGADPKQNEHLSLYLAQKKDDYNMMRLLVQYGADYNLLSSYEQEKALKPNPSSALTPSQEKLSPYNKIVNSRNELAASILKNLKNEGQLLPPAWNEKTICPQNPVTKIHYHGCNLLKLMYAAIERGVGDPRWCTYKQAAEMGWQIKKGAKGILCEKWIFTKEVEKKGPDGKVILDQHHKPIKETVYLAKPIPNYFIVFNGEDIKGIPDLDLPNLPYDNTLKLAEDFISSSECPIKEIAQKNAYYDPVNDNIVLPPKGNFRTTEDFLQIALHEMAHSTGHPTRLNRHLINTFGTPDYAREELNAELGSIFTKFDIGLVFHEGGYIETRNQQYIKSWIEILEKDQTEFFKACSNADKISRRLVYNYNKYLQLQNILVNTFGSHQNNITGQRTDSRPMHTDTALSSADAIRADFTYHHYACTSQLLHKVQELNRITDRVWSLNDIYQKWNSHEFCIPKEQELINDIADELSRQDHLRSHTPQNEFCV